MKHRRILVAEDDAHIREGLRDALENEGYEVTVARNGKEALMFLRQGDFHLVVLDIMMPELSGFDVCRKLRKSDAFMPILFLSAKGEEIDKVIGFELGGDDYLTKPFGVRELLARVAALLRRARPATGSGDGSGLPESFLFGGVLVDRKRHALRKDGSEIPLTAREMKLIETFFLSPGEVLSRDRLLDSVWGVKYYGTTRTLDQHIAQLRKKIECRPGASRYFHTVHGVGYRYDPPAESESAAGG